MSDAVRNILYAHLSFHKDNLASLERALEDYFDNEVPLGHVEATLDVLVEGIRSRLLRER